MKKKLSIIFISVLISIPTLGQWNFDPLINIPVVKQPNTQTGPVICKTTDGGYIIAWSDARTDLGDIYAQKFSPAGVPLWLPDGIPVCTLANAQNQVHMVADDVGGAYIVWSDQRVSVSAPDIYASRITSSGGFAAGWSANGNSITTAANSQTAPQVAFNGTNVFFVWEDDRTLAGNKDIYGAALTPSGGAVGGWITAGKSICSNSGSQLTPKIIATSTDVFYVWSDNIAAPNYQLYGHRFATGGTAIWATPGISFSNNGSISTLLDLSIKLVGTSIVYGWREAINSNDIFLKCVDQNGSVIWGGVNGTPYCSGPSSNDQMLSMAVSSDNQILIGLASNLSGNNDIIVQKISASAGTEIWTPGGVKATISTASETQPALVADLAGGCVVSYTMANATQDIYGQKISSSGAILWFPLGNAISRAGLNQNSPVSVGDGANGAVVCFLDSRNGNQDLYINAIDQNGNQPYNILASPTSGPTGTSVTLTGNNFPGVGVDSVMLNGVTVGVFSSNCPSPCNSLTFNVPGPTPVGTWPIDVFNRTGKNAGLVNFTVLPNTITTSSISGSSFCAGGPVSVSFTSTGTFSGTNDYIAQLSNASGSFSSPVTIGSITSSGVSSGTISCNILPGTPAGSGYRIRVVGNNPITAGTDNGANLIIDPAVTPTITISRTAGISPSCFGSPVTFTASITGGGATPSYQWQINGANVGTNSSTFTTSGESFDYTIACILTTTAPCASPAVVISNSITQYIYGQFTVNAGSDITACASDGGVSLNGIINAVGGGTYGMGVFINWGTTGNGIYFDNTNQNTSYSFGPTDISTGTVTLNMDAGDGCTSATDNLTITILPNPATPAVSSNSPVCTSGSLNLSGPTVAGAIYSWNGPNGFTSVVQNPTITNASSVNSGIYTLFVSVSGCLSPAGNTNVTVNPALTAITAKTDVTCNGVNNGTITFTSATGGSGSYEYSIDNGLSWQIGVNFSGLFVGIYNPVIRDAANITCSTSLGSMVITQPAGLNATSTSTDESCAGSGDGSIVFSGATGGSGVYEYSIDNGSFWQSATTYGSLSAGNYNLVIRDGADNSCTSALGSVTVSAAPSPVTSAITGSNSVCTNTVSSPYNVTFTSGSTYTWTIVGGTQVSGGNTNSITVDWNASGGGSVSVQETNGSCTGPVVNLPVTVNPGPTINAGADQTICAGSTASLSGIAGGSATGGTWGGGSGSFSPAVNVLNVIYTPSASDITSGLAILTLVSTGGGCPVVNDQVAITIIPTPTPPTTIGDNICSGNTGTVTASGAGTIKWYDSFTGGLFLDSGSSYTTVTLSSTTDFYAETSVGPGCVSTRSIATVSVNTPPSVPGAISGSPTYCNGGTGSYNVPFVSGVTYNWTLIGGGTITSGQGTDVITVSFATSPTQVCVTANNPCGTSASSCLSITGFSTPLSPSSITGPNSVCPNQTGVSYTCSLVTGATDYIWSLPTGATQTSGGTTNSITVDFGTSGGNVNVAAANPCGTSSNATFAVTIAAGIAIPDANLVAWLQTNYGGCMCGNLMDASCPAITSATFVNVSGLGISDLTGIEYFTSLQGLTCVSNSLSTLPTLPSGLVNLNCAGNSITSLPSLPLGLQSLICDHNAIPTLPALPNSLCWLQANTNQAGICYPNTPTCSTFTADIPACLGLLPSIYSFNPTTACENSVVTLNGSGFTNVTDVSINGFSVGSLNFTFINDTAIDVTVPIGAASGDIIVTTTVGASDPSLSPLTVTPAPTAILSGGSTICASGTDNLTVNFTGGAGPWDFTYTDGVTPVNITGATNPYTISVSPAATTTYSLTAVTEGSCTGTVSGTATTTVSPGPTAILSGGTSICASGTDNLTVNFTGGSGPWNFTYTDGVTPVNITGATNPYTISVSPATTTTYGLTGVTEGSCTGTVSGTATTTVIPAPTAILSGGSTICASGTDNLTVNFTGGAGPWNFTYTDGITPVNITGATNPYNLPVNPTATTTYSLTAVTEGSCTGTVSGTATTTVSPAPTAILSGGTSICASGTDNLTVNFTGGSGPWNFTYTDGVTPVNITAATNPYTISVSPTSTTTYSLTAVTEGSCTGTVSGAATTTVIPAPTAILSGGTTICASGTDNLTVNFTGGSGPWNFTYTDGVTPVNITGATNPYTISVSPTATTTYSLTAVTEGSCSGTVSGTATTTVGIVPTAILSGGATICASGTDNLTVNFTGGSGPWNFTYTDGVTPVNITGATNPYTISVSPAVTTTYSLTAVTEGSCTGTVSGTATTTVSPGPTAALSGGTNICVSGTDNLTVTFTGGSGPWNFTYTDGVTPVNIAGATNPYTISVSPAATTTYSLTAVTEGSCTGTVSGTATTTVSPAPTAILSGGTTICASGTDNLTVNFTGGSGPWNFTYTDGVTPVNITGATNPYTISVSPTATTTYSLTAVTEGSCSGTVSGAAITTIIPAPTATLSGGTTVCISGTDNLTVNFTGGSGPWNFTYTDGVTPVNITGATNPYTIIVSPATTTTYNLTAVTEGACSGTVSGSATTTVSPAPVITTTGGTQLCNGSVITISVPAGFTSYQWKLGSSTLVGEVNPNYTVVTPGNYTVDVADPVCGNLTSSPLTITNLAVAPVITAGGGAPYDTLLIATSAGATSYQWYAGQRAIYGANSGTYRAYFNAGYSVSVGFNNCKVKSSVYTLGNPSMSLLTRQSFIMNDSTIFIPQINLIDDKHLTVFPNPMASDGHFTANYKCISSGMVSMHIYNSLGNLITSKEFPMHSGLISADFDEIRFAPGIYLLYVSENGSTVVKTISIY
jgi:hypothetical protein